MSKTALLVILVLWIWVVYNRSKAVLFFLSFAFSLQVVSVVTMIATSLPPDLGTTFCSSCASGKSLMLRSHSKYGSHAGHLHLSRRSALHGLEIAVASCFGLRRMPFGDVHVQRHLLRPVAPSTSILWRVSYCVSTYRTKFFSVSSAIVLDLPKR